MNGRTIIEFSRTCRRQTVDHNNQPTVIQQRATFRIVLARSKNDLGTVTGPTRADVYQLVPDGPMAQPTWCQVHAQSLYGDGGGYRLAALDEGNVIGLAMDRIAELAASAAAWPTTVTADYTLINLGELA